MKKVGVTGGIGSGKTTVCKIFEEFGIPVYYSDAEARKIMTSNDNLVAEIIKDFGPESFAGNELNKDFLSAQVFNDPEKLLKLNSIVHPYVIEAFYQWCKAHKNQPYIIIESALLVETKLYQTLDYLICVIADKEERINRILKRDKISKEEIIRRMENQMNDEEKIQYADFVIVSGNLTDVRNEVEKIHRLLCK